MKGLLPQEPSTYFKDTTTAINYRLVVSKDGSGPLTMQAFVWDGQTWHPLGTATTSTDGEAFDAGTAVLTKLTISTRSSSPTLPDPRSFLRGVAVTQLQKK